MIEVRRFLEHVNDVERKLREWLNSDEPKEVISISHSSSGSDYLDILVVYRAK